MKRLLAFLLLLALGLVGLKFAIGDDQALPVAAGAKEQKPAPEVPSGFELPPGKIQASVSQSGPLQNVTEWREYRDRDGTVRKQEVFVLNSRGSQPLGGGVQQLDGLELALFDRGKHVANVTAEQAFLALHRDATGKFSLQQGKDLDLRTTVLTGLPGSKMAGLRLELGDAKVKITDDEILLTTAPEQPVKLVFDGAQKAELRGIGAQAQFPRGRDGSLRRADIEILRQPVLDADGIRVRAKGRLHYSEDTVAGTARITVDDDVDVELTRADLTTTGIVPTSTDQPASTPAPTTVRGDQFNGWLLRSTVSQPGREQQRMVWRRLELTGAPAVVTMQGGRLLTPRLTAQPGLFGDLMVLTAHGGESRLEQTELAKDQDQLVVGQARRRLHVIRPGEGTGAVHRAFGFPRWAMRPVYDLQIVAGDGAARFDSGASSVRASDGIRVLRRDGTNCAIVHGFGRVQVEQPAQGKEPAFRAEGSDGCMLVTNPREKRLRLGPAAPEQEGHDDARWRAHHYEVSYGEARLQGHGSCLATRRGERIEVDQLDPVSTATADLPGQVQLRALRRLHAVLQGDRVEELELAGWPIAVTMRSDDSTITARAPRLSQAGPGSLRLLPVPIDAPAGMWRELAVDEQRPLLVYEGRIDGADKPGRIELRGPRIDVHHLGGGDAMVDAIEVDGELPSITGSLPQPDRDQPLRLDCTAHRLRLLPFAASRNARWMHGGLGDAFGRITHHTAGEAWMLVDRVVRFVLDDELEGRVEGTAHRLLVSRGGMSALFVGDPDRSLPAEVRRDHEGRSVTMRGARVRVRRETGERDQIQLFALGTFDDRSAVLSPMLVLHEPGKGGLLSHMQAICRGNIEVRPKEILFGGPVVADALTANEAPDPEGLHIDARELHMVRTKGDITKVTGRDVQLDWPQVQARSAELELDLTATRLTARDPKWATVTLADGMVFRSPFVEVDYENLSVRTQRGHGRQRDPVKEATR